MSELLDADEEFAFLIEPATQQRPFAQQRLVRHFHGRGIANAFDGEQACARQAFQQRPRFGRQRLQLRGTAHIFAFGIDAHHRGHKGVAQSVQIFRRGLAVTSTSSALAHRIFQRRKLRGLVAKSQIGLERKLLIWPKRS